MDDKDDGKSQIASFYVYETIGLHVHFYGDCNICGKPVAVTDCMVVHHVEGDRIVQGCINPLNQTTPRNLRPAGPSIRRESENLENLDTQGRPAAGGAANDR